MAVISRDLSASLRSRFGAQLLQEEPHVVIAPASPETVQGAVEVARREHFRILPLGSGSSFPATYSRLRPDTMGILMGALEGESGGDAFSSWFWAGTKLHRLASSYPGIFAGEGQRATLGGLIATKPEPPLDSARRLLKRLLMSMEVLTAAGNLEMLAGEGTGTINDPAVSHLLFGSQGRLGIILRVRLRRVMPPDTESAQLPENHETTLSVSTGQPALKWSQLQALLDPGGLFAWRADH